MEEKQAIAANILSKPVPERFEPAPLVPLVPINAGAELPQLAPSERAHLPFKLLYVSEDFLHLDPTDWPNDPSYQRVAEFVKNFRVVNDLAENAVQLATDYNEKVTRNETQRQCLYLTVQQQRRERSDLRRRSLQPNRKPAQVSTKRQSKRRGRKLPTTTTTATSLQPNRKHAQVSTKRRVH